MRHYSKRIVIAGGSGFLGQALTLALEAEGFRVVLLSRSAGSNAVEWDGKTVAAWASHLEGAFGVVNLAGASVTMRWTSASRAKIVSSRVDSTKSISRAISQCEVPPLVWVNGSAIGIYGDRGSTELDEKSAIGQEDDFMVSCCKAWEAACLDGECASRRVVFRTGVVLGQGGGAFPILSQLTKLLLGGAVGSGKQYVSWIHVLDWVRMVLWGLGVGSTGTNIRWLPGNALFNATAPSPVTNADLMKAMRKVYGRPWSPPVPEFALKAVTALRGMEATPLLQGQRVLPGKAIEEGFEFIFPDIEGALKGLKG